MKYNENENSVFHTLKKKGVKIDTLRKTADCSYARELGIKVLGMLDYLAGHKWLIKMPVRSFFTIR
jgi:hypothetical protein